MKIRPAEWIILATAVWIGAVRLVVEGGLSLGYVLGGVLEELALWTLIVGFFFLLYIGFELVFSFGKSSLNSLLARLIEGAGGFRDLMPLLFLSFVFTNIGAGYSLVRKTGFKDITPLLLKADEIIFGVQPSVCMQEVVRPILTEYMSMIYMVYPGIVLLAAFWLRWRHGGDVCKDYVLALVLASCIAYVFFILLPAVSPEYVIEYWRPLSGHYFTNSLRVFLGNARSIENDCCLFPSLHVGLSTLAWLYVRRAQSRLNIPFAVLAVSEWVSPVYLRRHYAVDALAGIMLALFCYHASLEINRRWRERRVFLREYYAAPKNEPSPEDEECYESQKH